MKSHTLSRASEVATSAVALDGVHAQMVANLILSVVEVFDTMVGHPLVVEAARVEAPRPSTYIVGTVGFAGSASGFVSFGCSRAAALDITTALLGPDIEPATKDLTDAIGEITNMVAGSFRTKMVTEDDRWVITVPTVTAGDDFCITCSDTTFRVVCPLTMGAHRLFVELVLQPTY